MRPESLASCPSALSSRVFSCTSSAASRNRPCASSTAATIPVAPEAAATKGGGTRSGSSARTTTCASGRKRRSQTTSWPTFALRERARALDKRGLVDRLPGSDQLAAALDVIPDVPVQEPARPPVLVDVRDDPLAVRLLP